MTLQALVHTTLREESPTKLPNTVSVTNPLPTSHLSLQDLVLMMPPLLEDMIKSLPLTLSESKPPAQVKIAEPQDQEHMIKPPVLETSLVLLTKSELPREVIYMVAINLLQAQVLMLLAPTALTIEIPAQSTVLDLLIEMLSTTCPRPCQAQVLTNSRENSKALVKVPV